MGKVEKLDLISEPMLWNREDSPSGEKLPQGRRWCDSFFMDELEDTTDAVNKFSAFIEERCSMAGKNIYLCMVGEHGGTPRIRNYYKLWKLVKKKYPIDGFVLGNEYEICIGDRTVYCGIAKANREALDIAVRIAFDLPQSSYLYITNKEFEIHSAQVKKFFEDTIACDFNSYGGKYDYIKIYNHMKENEYVLNFRFDGEGVALHISEVYEGGR